MISYIYNIYITKMCAVKHTNYKLNEMEKYQSIFKKFNLYLEIVWMSRK